MIDLVIVEIQPCRLHCIEGGLEQVVQIATTTIRGMGLNEYPQGPVKSPMAKASYDRLHRCSVLPPLLADQGPCPYSSPVVVDGWGEG